MIDTDDWTVSPELMNAARDRLCAHAAPVEPFDIEKAYNADPNFWRDVAHLIAGPDGDWLRAQVAGAALRER